MSTTLPRSSRRARLAGLTGLVATTLVLPLAAAAPAHASASAAGTQTTTTQLPMTTSYWFAKSGESLSSVAGYGSSAGLEVANTSGAPATTVLNDTVNSVSSTVTGTTYSATAWVRSATAGQTVGLRLSEYANTTFRGQNQGTVWLRDTAWHQVSVSYTAVSTGASIDVNALTWALPTGASFDVSAVALTVMGDAGSAPAPGQPPASAPAPAPPTSTPPVTTPPSTPPTTPTPPPPPAGGTPSLPGYHEVWSDEFNGTSLNTSQWYTYNDSTYGDGGGSIQCLEAANVTESGGQLDITGDKVSTPVHCGSNDTKFPNGRSYTSGHISTYGHEAFKYGYFEIRAKLPTQANTSKGLWPAFWLRPVSGGLGEIDVLEAIGSAMGQSTEASLAHQTIWYDYNNTYPKQAYAAHMSSDATNWHTYGLLWSPGQLQFYVDGVVTFTRDLTTTPWLNAAFSQPFFIRLNMAIGGTWPGNPDANTAFPATYGIDYIRVYQQ